MDFLPAGLWLIAVMIGIAVCIRCMIDGELVHGNKSRKHNVQPLSWGIMAMQPVTLVLGMVPYAVYKYAKSRFSSGSSALYASVLIPSAIVMVVIVILELVFMYLQAQRSYTDVMDNRIADDKRGK